MHVCVYEQVADEGSDSEDCHSEQKEDEEEEGKEVYGVTSVIGLSSNKVRPFSTVIYHFILLAVAG